MNEQILIAEEVAEILRVDKQRVWSLIRENQIPFIRLGERQYRFSKQAIENWLANGGNNDTDNGRVEVFSNALTEVGNE